VELPRAGRGGNDGQPSLTTTALVLVASYVVLAGALIVIGLVLVHVLAPVRHWDDHVNAWFAAHRTPRWTRVSKDGTFLADTFGVVVVAVAATLVALVCRCGRWSALLLSGLAVELAVFLTVNYTVRRPRPAVPHVGSTPSTYSFPSGHVAATLVLYGGIAVLVSLRTRVWWARGLAWAVAAAMVVWVGFSRMYEAEHHPTDVIAGLCLGVGALTAATVAVGTRVRTQDDRHVVTGSVVARRSVTGAPRLGAPEEEVAG
jgi:undecaprenyl-diphosphatase